MRWAHGSVSERLVTGETRIRRPRVRRRWRAPLLALAITAVVVAAYMGWRSFTRYTVCAAESPDGSRRAVVSCHFVPTAMDGRYHYYLTFDPPVEFRIRFAGGSTLKDGPSASKDDRVTDGWATTHFIGYLQGFDGVDDRGPSSIEWQGNRVVVHGREGVVCEVELRE